jgi:hypothetical protein
LLFIATPIVLAVQEWRNKRGQSHDK